MAACESAAASITTTTYTDVITKFKELNKSYYSTRGCMISTLSDDFSKNFWKRILIYYGKRNIIHMQKRLYCRLK